MSLSFDDVKLKHVDPFLKACGVDPFRNDILYAYIRRTIKSGRPYSHLEKRQLKRFEILSERYLKMTEEKNKAVSPAVAA